MTSFDTFWERCYQALVETNFVWPDGIEFINYPATDPKDDFVVHKPKD